MRLWKAKARRSADLREDDPRDQERKLASMDKDALFGKIEKIKMPIRIAILVGTMVVLVGVFVAAVYMPKSEEITKISKNIDSLNQKLRQVKIRLRNMDKIKMEFEQVNEEFKEALKILPDSREIPALLKAIDQLGKDSELEFQLFSPQNEVEREFFVEIPVSLELVGSYHNVAVFFDKIGRMERIVNITNVAMYPKAELSTILNTRCNAVTYRFKGKVEVDEKTPENKGK
jgi:type IV pilus assembly protein PilO